MMQNMTYFGILKFSCACILVFILTQLPFPSLYKRLFTTEMLKYEEIFKQKMNESAGIYKADKPDDPRHVYITVTVNADDRGLANQMFIYAAMIGIARKQNMIPVIQQQQKALSDIFQLTSLHQNDLNRQNINVTYHPFNSLGRVYCMKYDKRVEQLRNNTMLNGYFQSWVYFNESMDEIRKEFRFKPALLKKADDYSTKHDLVCKQCIRVGIHVRRGDFLSQNSQDLGFTTANITYINKAMNYFRAKYKKLQFLVCSNGIRWAKYNIIGKDVVFSQSRSAAIDMILLSQCDHMIMTTGSYSWWSAFLAGGTTIYYNYWPKPGTMLHSAFDKHQFFFPDWIPM